MWGKKKKKAARRVKEEQKETSSESSDSEGEQEVKWVIRDQMWPGTSTTARKRHIRHIVAEGVKDESESINKIESSNKSEGSNKNEAGNFKTKTIGAGDLKTETSNAGDFHQDRP